MVHAGQSLWRSKGHPRRSETGLQWLLLGGADWLAWRLQWAKHLEHLGVPKHVHSSRYGDPQQCCAPLTRLHAHPCMPPGSQAFQTSLQQGAGEKEGVVHYPLADAGSRELPRPGKLLVRPIL